MAKSLGEKVTKLLFVSKPGGTKKCNQPGRVAVKDWLKQTHKIDIEIIDLDNKV